LNIRAESSVSVAKDMASTPKPCDASCERYSVSAKGEKEITNMHLPDIDAKQREVEMLNAFVQSPSVPETDEEFKEILDHTVTEDLEQIEPTTMVHDQSETSETHP
jgi:hypothetical protein